ncbi:MAG: hypothetical protein IANPNBLG_00991 [Bryobacteraceae bacterium]|nr:hypothetical protein [Bryobacteraceae bacterium]
MSRQAEWKCDPCRRTGLDVKRNCSWLDLKETTDKPVWARNGVYTTVCPKSIVSPDSEHWIHLFYSMKLLNQHLDLLTLDARTADALMTLETEYRKETLHA